MKSVLVYLLSSSALVSLVRGEGIGDLSQHTREQLCARNKDTCAAMCANAVVVTNSCDDRSLVFECECIRDGGTLLHELLLFPVAQYLVARGISFTNPLGAYIAPELLAAPTLVSAESDAGPAVFPEALSDEQVASQTNEQVRSNLCAQNIKSCSNKCTNAVIRNSCNPNSLQWECACKDKTVSFDDLDFPVPSLICQAKFSDCYHSACKGDSTCMDNCIKTYKCGNVTATGTGVLSAPSASTSLPPADSDELSLAPVSPLPLALYATTLISFLALLII
jgi:hypothetical protein